LTERQLRTRHTNRRAHQALRPNHRDYARRDRADFDLIPAEPFMASLNAAITWLVPR
jgi:hypothetical protein